MGVASQSWTATLWVRQIYTDKNSTTAQSNIKIVKHYKNTNSKTA